jgi:hypothetical protein
MVRGGEVRSEACQQVLERGQNAIDQSLEFSI